MQDIEEAIKTLEENGYKIEVRQQDIKSNWLNPIWEKYDDLLYRKIKVRFGKGYYIDNIRFPIRKVVLFTLGYRTMKEVPPSDWKRGTQLAESLIKTILGEAANESN